MKNESNQSETVADIVAQMRGRGEDGRMDMSLWRDYADRIDAAWKRERSKIEADALAVGGIVEAARTAEKSSAVGNAATMLEALASVRNWCINKLVGASFQVTVEGLLSIVEAALSAPPRNCDVGTAEEQNKRYEHYCFTHRTVERCCQDCPIKDEPCCELAWAQMPYEAQE